VRLFCRYSGLPEKLVSDDELGLPEQLAEILAQGVIGQDAACRAFSEVLTRFKAGVADPEKPLGSLLFVGPTGVGKTELAKQLARFMFGSAERMVRIDMSEYMTAGSTQRLLADEKGALSLAQRVSQDPLSLVLLDEIEKAHPAVFDLLLGILGEGRLTSQRGRLVDFRMTLIVMTSNLGTGGEPAGFGRDAVDSDDALRAVRQHFRPEFFNRLDYVVPFGALSKDAVHEIVELELSAAGRREGLVRKNLRLSVAAEAKARLCELGFHPKYGARPLKRAIEEHVMTPIAIELSRRPKLANAEVRVSVESGQIRVSFS
jgi:ATP-dependent Clp protease ATP-binding subunit ClpC